MHGVIDRDPSIGLSKPAAEVEERRALTDAERTAALKVGNEHPEGLLLLLLYYTGMRIGEATGLQWGDIDFTGRLINVSRDMDYKTGELGDVKSEASVRSIPMCDELADVLRPCRSFGAAFVLPSDKAHGPLPKASLVKRWKRLVIAMLEADPSIERKEVGSRKGDKKPDGKREEIPVYGSVLTAHYFRHNYASLLYDADVDILSAQKFLGHAKVETTLKIYTHLSKGKEDKNAEKARGMFSPETKVAEKLPN
jgi:integrase